MNRLYTASVFFTLFIFQSFSVQSQEIITSEFAGSFDEVVLEIVFGQDFQNGVEFYSVTYSTDDVEGRLDTASGLLVLPVGLTEEIPYLIYQHGTVASKDDVPSKLAGGYQLALAFAGYGYATIAPDYMGLGTSRGFHPYIHADSEASAAIDMLIASKDLVSSMGIETNDDLYVTGYSQGGHAAMAAFQVLERDYADELPVRAAAPLSGPYDVSGKMVEFTLGDTEYGTVSYLPYLAVGYQRVYQDILGDSGLAGFFKAPYVDMITKFSNHEIDLNELNSFLVNELIAREGASIPKYILQDSILNAILNEPDHPVSMALADNDVYDWTPNAPMRMFYCTGDEQVFYENSLKAETVMNANGAADVKAMNVGEGLTHGECVIPAALAAIQFFNEVSMTSNLAELTSDEYKVYPNPVNDKLNIEIQNQNISQVYIYDVTGKLVFESNPSNDSSLLIDVSNWAEGFYTAQIRTESNVATQKIVVKH